MHSIATTQLLNEGWSQAGVQYCERPKGSLYFHRDEFRVKIALRWMRLTPGLRIIADWGARYSMTSRCGLHLHGHCIKGRQRGSRVVSVPKR